MHRPNRNDRYGVYFGPNDRRNVSERLEGSLQTNNRAELAAILKALGVSVRDNCSVRQLCEIICLAALTITVLLSITTRAPPPTHHRHHML